MGLLAVKHLDPVVGIDVHSVLVAPSPTPMFLPHPHVGFMLDLREYIEAAKGVVGSIAMAIAQEKAAEYLEDHPDVAKKLDDAAEFASGKLTDIEENSIVAEGLKLEQQAAALQSRIGNMFGAGVGMGGAAGRPIFVNGLMRATAGTHSYHVPGLHFPLGESFAPPPEPDPIPSDDAESYMGSRTVLANNDPMSFMALPALSCWSIGLEPPGHNSAHTDRTYPSMPSSVMLPIPAGRPVMVGGPPVLNMAAAAKGLFKAFQGSKWAKSLADKLNLKPGFLKCKVLDAEPVDSITGQVVVQQHDFTISGRLPLTWDRCYTSNNTWCGAVGVGWQTPADIRLELGRHSDAIDALAYFPDHTTAFDTIPDTDGWEARVRDWQHGYSLYRRDGVMVLRTRAGLEYEFALPAHQPCEWNEHASEARLILPVKRFVDLNGNAWVLEREPNSSLTCLIEWKVDETTGRVIECKTRTGDGAGRNSNLLTSLTLIDANGCSHPLVDYEHDQNNDLISVCDAMKQPHRFAYSVGHRMMCHTSARGISFSYNHQQHDDGAWRVERAWGDNGLFDYHFVYDLKHRETRIADSLGYMTILQANERGMPVARIDPLGAATTYRYDTQGRTCAETDPSGRIMTWEYDVHGNLLAQTQPDGRAVRTEYGTDHNPNCIVDAWGRQWKYVWDDRGNLIRKTTPWLADTTYEYDRHGQLIALRGPYGTVTRFDYDRDGNLERLSDALGYCTQYTHDARANVIQIIDVLGQINRYEYDRNGNLTRTIEPGGRERHCSYDADGNLTRYRDANGHITRREYSALGHVTKRHAPDGGVVEYRYDTEERLICLINERSEHYQLKRDALGRIVEEVDYWGQSRRYEYGNASELLRSIDPLGQAIDYKVDALGRIVQKRVPDSRQPDGIRIETFSYDRHGNLIVAENPDCRIELAYDVAGRLIEERQGDDFVIAYDYDDVGNQIERRTQFTEGDEIIAHTVRYGYDVLGSVCSISIDDMAAITVEADALGQICVERLGDELRREFSFTSGGQLAKQALVANTGPLFVSEYGYDADNAMTEKRDSRLGTERYEYDPMGKLTQHIDPAGKLRRFLYDPAGDLMKTRIRLDSENAQFSWALGPDTWICERSLGDCYYAFDRLGNLVRKTDGQRDLQLWWDGDGLLTETLMQCQGRPDAIDTNRPPSIHTRYDYDAFHRRVKKITRIGHVDGTSPENSFDSTAPSRTTRFFWQGDTLVGEVSNGGADAVPSRMRKPAGSMAGYGEAREWIYYPETFRPLAEVRCAYSIDAGRPPTDDVRRPRYPDEKGQACRAVLPPNLTRQLSVLHYFHTDPNGAPVRIIDPVGVIVWEGGYSAWGAITAVEAFEEFDQPLRLQGQYRDVETGLHYNRHRYYDPDGGNFISQDPIGLMGGVNLYRYAPDTINATDPLGLSPWGRGPDENTTAWRGPNEIRVNVEIDHPRKGRILGEYAPLGGKHAEQVAIADHKHDIRGAEVKFTNIEGLYVRKQRDTTGRLVRHQEWLPTNVCSLVCRPDIFEQLHQLGAVKVEAPQVTSNVRKGNFIVPASRLHETHLSMNSLKDIALGKCKKKAATGSHDESCIPNHQSVVSQGQTKWFKANGLWQPEP